jgi:hypothetical protein
MMEAPARPGVSIDTVCGGVERSLEGVLTACCYNGEDDCCGS